MGPHFFASAVVWQLTTQTPSNPSQAHMVWCQNHSCCAASCRMLSGHVPAYATHCCATRHAADNLWLVVHVTTDLSKACMHAYVPAVELLLEDSDHHARRYITVHAMTRDQSMRGQTSNHKLRSLSHARTHTITTCTEKAKDN